GDRNRQAEKDQKYQPLDLASHSTPVRTFAPCFIVLSHEAGWPWLIYGNSVRRKHNSFYLADLLSDRALEHIADQMSQASVTGTFELRKRAPYIPELVNCNLPNGSNSVAALRTFALLSRETIPDERDPALTTETLRLHRLVRQVAAARREG